LFRTRPRISEPIAIAAGLFAVSLALRVFSFILFPNQGYPDSFYYTAVARSLAAGHGFSVPYLYSFIEVGSIVPAHGVLPIPSNAMWMPLASIVQVPFIWLLGSTNFASAAPFLLLGAGLSPATYAFVRDMARPEIKTSRTPAILAGLLALSVGSISAFLAQPDNFALYALLVLAVMWITGRLLRGDPGIVLGRLRLGGRGSLAVAGVLAGLAYLSRNDGVLVVLVIGLIWLGGALAARHSGKRPAISFGGLMVFGGAALLTVLPWLVRQMVTFGSFSPAAATGRALWIRIYQEFYSADGPIGPSYLLSWGPAHLLTSRFEALAVIVLLVVVYLLFLVGPFWLFFGLRHNLRRPELRPYFVWLIVLLVWEIGVGSALVTTGSFLHSVVSVMPLLYLLVADGVFEFRDIACRHVKRFSPAGMLHKSVFVLLMITGMYTVALPIEGAGQWTDYRDPSIPALAAIEAHGGAGQTVMAGDPGLIWSIDSNLVAIQTPFSSLAVIHAAALSYGARWLVLNRDFSVDALGPVLAGRVHPDWLSAAPIYVSPTTKASPIPEVAVFQILDTGT
jgi:hypothetical protein